MSTGRPDPLSAAARALADGRKIDWARLEATGGEAAACAEELRVLQSIARACAGPIESGSGPSNDAASGLSNSPSPAPLARWGHLEILERVGAGGFGEVFRAFDTVLHREVALKLRRFSGEAEAAAFEVHLEEARRLARLRHPNVLSVYGVEVHDGRAGMWTDFIRGETLEERLATRGPLEAAELIRTGLDLCAAIDAVHRADLLHGDIKAANAMREENGRTILMDFGAGSTSSARPSALGPSPQGTPIAMAPELLEGGPGSVASDLYSLGVLLYRLSTGRYPVTASSWSELMDKHRRREVLPVRELRPQLPASAARGIDRCLARDPAARPHSARELASFLRASGVTGEDETAEGELAAVGGAIHGDPPVFASRLVGRRRELFDLRRLLLEARLVTLTGSGGCGKTRLAHRAAEEAASSARDGAVWVALEALQDPGLLPQTVARAVGIAESRQRPALEQVLDHLRDHDGLVVLDNCEHLLPAVRELVEVIVSAAARVHILATSREPLQLPFERTLRVPSLSLPGAGPEAPGLEVLESEAVRLFVDRASQQRPGFAVTPAMAPALARIVRRLDGLPLALELAAARAGALTVEQIADRLEEGFRLVAGREASILPRRQTILASIEWSYRLLSAEEQRCLARVSVFAGGWTLEAAEAVCEGEAEDTPVVDLLETLVRRSMIQFDATSTPRYRLLETVHVFAADRLRDLGEETGLRQRHQAWFLRLAQETAPRLRSPNSEETLQLLDAELDNLRIALARALESAASSPEAREIGLNLCTALSRYWFLRGYYREGAAHFTAHLNPATGMTAARGRCLVAAATVLWPTGELEQAWRSACEGLQVLRAAGDTEWVPAALSTLGYLAELRGDPEEARRSLAEARAGHEAAGNDAGVASSSVNLGVLETRLGNHRESVPHYEQAIPLLRTLGDETNAAVAMRNLSYSLVQIGEVQRARALAAESISILRRAGQRRQLATSLSALVDVELAEGRYEEAGRHALEALHLARESGEKVTLLAALTALGLAAFFLRQDDRAARLHGTAEALHETLGIPVGEGEKVEWERRQRELRQRLGPARFDALWSQGRAQELDAVIAGESGG